MRSRRAPVLLGPLVMVGKAMGLDRFRVNTGARCRRARWIRHYRRRKFWKNWCRLAGGGFDKASPVITEDATLRLFLIDTP